MATSVRQITDATGGAIAGDDVRQGRLGDLAGEGRKWLRAPDLVRQTAEAHARNLPQLSLIVAWRWILKDTRYSPDIAKNRRVSG